MLKFLIVFIFLVTDSHQFLTLKELNHKKEVEKFSTMVFNGLVKTK